MKRLFKLTHNDGTVVHYSSKQEAKKARDTYNKDASNKPIVVSRGPDHRNYRGK